MESLFLAQGIAQFLRDRKQRGCAGGTLTFYRDKLKIFLAYCEAHDWPDLPSVTTDQLRLFLMDLEPLHSPGGVHAIFRAVRALFCWYGSEYEPAGWRNPITKRIKAPRVPEELLDPVDLDTVHALLDTCARGRTLDLRDRAILRTLIDTGLRASELIALDVEDVDFSTGEVKVIGKGQKARVVFVGRRSRQALRAYLRGRAAPPAGARAGGPIFLTRSGEQLAYPGLRAVILRRAKLAKLPAPTLHAFRRAFALTSVRARLSDFALQRLMGHKLLATTQRYVKLNTDDLREAHAEISPVDRHKL